MPERRIEAPRAFHYGVGRARWLPDGTIVVIDVRSYPDEDNAWIMSDTGDVLHNFHIGDGVGPVLVSDRHIVVGYFDEGIYQGVFGERDIGREGLIVFSHRGGIELGYLSRFSDRIDDCYALCWRDVGKTLLLCPYSHFEAVRIDLDDQTREASPTPDAVHGAGAISSVGDVWLFAGPYKHREDVFALDLKSGEVKRIAEYQGNRMRGLPGGRFLCVRDEGYAIVSFDDDVRALGW